MPPKLRELKARLKRAGFVERPGRGKGSHSIWQHPAFLEMAVTLSGGDGDDAHRYQERQVDAAIRQAKTGTPGTDLD